MSCHFSTISSLVSVSHETVIHQFFKCRLSLVHSRASVALFTYLHTHPPPPPPPPSSISTPSSDLENVIFFHPFSSSSSSCSLLSELAKKRWWTHRENKILPSSHISFNSTYCFIFNIFFFFSLSIPWKKPLLLLLQQQQQISHANSSRWGWKFPLFHALVHFYRTSPL